MESDTEKNLLILPLTYYGTIDYWKLLFSSNSVVIDIYEHYIKQTIRNHTDILSANRLLKLSIPTEKYKNNSHAKDIKISYAENWQVKHWRSITSAYNNSAYFQFYKDALFPFYEKKKYTFLTDLNINLLYQLLQLLKVKQNFTISEKYIAASGNCDYRKILSQNNPAIFPCKKYIQVFECKENNIGNISILDVLCNLGPETKTYLL